MMFATGDIVKSKIDMHPVKKGDVGTVGKVGTFQMFPVSVRFEGMTHDLPMKPDELQWFGVK